MSSYTLWIFLLGFSIYGWIDGALTFELMDTSDGFSTPNEIESIAFAKTGELFSNNQERELSNAAGRGDVGKVRELILLGTNVNATGKQGVTPLFVAMREGSLIGFEELLRLGANPNAKFADSSIIHWAAANEDVRYLRKLLEYGADPNLQAGDDEITPIFVTIRVDDGRDLSALQVLLEAGANVNVQTAVRPVFGRLIGGKTPSMLAAELVRLDIVYELLIHGADYNIQDHVGRDVLDRIRDYSDRLPVDGKQTEYYKFIESWLSKKGTEGLKNNQ